MTYIDDNPARNCPEFLTLIHNSIASGFLQFKISDDYTRLDCGIRMDCHTCHFASHNSKFCCPSGGVVNRDLVAYLTTCYSEYFL